MGNPGWLGVPVKAQFRMSDGEPLVEHVVNLKWVRMDGDYPVDDPTVPCADDSAFHFTIKLPEDPAFSLRCTLDAKTLECVWAAVRVGVHETIISVSAKRITATQVECHFTCEANPEFHIECVVDNWA